MVTLMLTYDYSFDRAQYKCITVCNFILVGNSLNPTCRGPILYCSKAITFTHIAYGAQVGLDN